MWQKREIAEFLQDVGVCSSKTEAKRLIRGNGISFNKEKVHPETKWMLINLETKQYILAKDIHSAEGDDDKEGEFILMQMADEPVIVELAR
jgi:hypothetical protein